jgi:hypothetical protein
MTCTYPGIADVALACNAAGHKAGLHDVAESDVRGCLEVDSGGDYGSLLTEVSAPVVAVLAGVDDATSNRIRAATIEKA